MSFSETTVPVRGGMFGAQMVRGGSGPPLLYLHGSGGMAGWAPWLDRLAERFDVLSPAHPGFNRSEGVEQLDDIRDLAIYYLDFLDELGIERAHLLGHSLGGMLAAEIAAMCPHVVDRMVLVAPVGLWRDDAPVLDFFAVSPKVLNEALHHDPNSEAARQFMALPEDEEGRRQAQILRAQNFAAAARFLWPIPDKGLKKRIHRVKAPTLLLWGQSDGIVPPIYGSEFQQLIPGSRLEVFSASGHRPMFEEPDRFHQVVTEFLAS